MSMPHAPLAARDAGLPPQAGIGFKPQHFEALAADPAPPAFVEVHAENYLGAGGLPHAQLRALRERMALSIHGVGLSIGGATPPDANHLARIAALVARYEPASFSEHLAWSTHHGRFFNDLLPLCYDDAALRRVCEHVDRVQSALGRCLLLENPAAYFDVPGNTWPEPAFLAAIVARTGCGLLLDVNNVHVSCHNRGDDALAYLHALPLDAVGEVHLAGHARDADGAGRMLLVDDHGSPVSKAVWTLYDALLARIGALPTVIEWDTDVPDYAVLRAEAHRADGVLAAHRGATGGTRHAA